MSLPLSFINASCSINPFKSASYEILERGHFGSSFCPTFGRVSGKRLNTFSTSPFSSPCSFMVFLMPKYNLFVLLCFSFSRQQYVPFFPNANYLPTYTSTTSVCRYPGHANCASRSGGGDSFGRLISQYASQRVNGWATTCRVDSDGDGLTNGTESSLSLLSS